MKKRTPKKKHQLVTRVTLVSAASLFLFVIMLLVTLFILFQTQLKKESILKAEFATSLLLEAVELKKDELTLDFEDVQEEDKLNQIASYFVYDTNDVLVADNNNEYWMEEYPPVFGAYQEIHKDSEDWIFYDIESYDDGEQLGWVRIVIPLLSPADSFPQMLFALLLAIPICLIIALIAMYCSIRKAFKPIEHMTLVAQEIEQGAIDKRVPESDRRDELDTLAHAFNTMLDSLSGAFMREKRFTSDAAHELRTPTAVIMAYADEALNNSSITLEESKHTLQIILNKSQHMQKLLSQLLFLARGADQTNLVEFTEFDASFLIEDVVDELSQTAEQKSITIKTDLDSNATLYADMVLFSQLMINLIDNAIKYNIENGSILITLVSNLENITITVQDTGQGIASNDLDAIFNRFYRADSSRSGQSFGLGLSIVEWIVSAHHADISVSSTVGKGTTFSLVFPRKQSLS